MEHIKDTIKVVICGICVVIMGLNFWPILVQLWDSAVSFYTAMWNFSPNLVRVLTIEIFAFIFLSLVVKGDRKDLISTFEFILAFTLVFGGIIALCANVSS